MHARSLLGICTRSNCFAAQRRDQWLECPRPVNQKTHPRYTKRCHNLAIGPFSTPDTRVIIRYRNAQLQFKCESGHGDSFGCCLSVDTVLVSDGIVHFYSYTPYRLQHMGRGGITMRIVTAMLRLTPSPSQVQESLYAIEIHSCNPDLTLAIEIVFNALSLWRPHSLRRYRAFLQLRCEGL